MNPTDVLDAMAEQTRLLRNIVDVLQTGRDVPEDKVLWTAEQIGEYLQVSPRTVAEKYAVKPGFPTAVRPGGGYPRWFAAEVIDWVEDSRRKTRRTWTKKQ